MMPNSWKWKLVLLVGLIVLSFYMLVPTFFGFAEKREEAANNMTQLPWYFSVFPDKGINLGLDLRGGIYLEFEIDASAAVVNQLIAEAAWVMARGGETICYTNEVVWRII